MNGTFFQAETVETPVRYLKIRFEKSFAAPHAGDATAEPLLIFEELVNRNLARGYLRFDLDLENIPFPATRFIALLIALTVRVRRRQGEVRLLNVAGTARNNFSTFSALNFLTIESEPASQPLMEAIKQPPAKIQNLNATAARAKAAGIKFSASPASQSAPNPIALRENFLIEDEVSGLTDIAEPPLIAELVEKIEAPLEADGEKKFQLRVESRTANLYQLCDFVTNHAFAAGINEKEIAKMKIAVYEACLNVIEHAYHSRPDEWIDLRVRYSPERFMIVIQDNGLSFEMKPPKDYDVQEVIDKRRSGGFGLHIIRRAMDSVEYLPDAMNGNRLVMVKRLK